MRTWLQNASPKGQQKQRCSKKKQEELLEEPTKQTTRGSAANLPASAQKVVDNLRANGVEITGEGLKNALSHPEMKRLYSTMEYHNNQHNRDAADAYRNQRLSTNDRRQWLARFLLRPASGGCVGVSEHQAVHDELDVEDENWLTLDTLSGPVYFNNFDHAKIVCATLPSRPHENVGLAAEGVMQYLYASSKKVKRTGTKSSAGVRKEADVDNSTAEVAAGQIMESMGNNELFLNQPKAKAKAAGKATAKSKMVLNSESSSLG